MKIFNQWVISKLNVDGFFQQETKQQREDRLFEGNTIAAMQQVLDTAKAWENPQGGDIVGIRLVDRDNSHFNFHLTFIKGGVNDWI